MAETKRIVVIRKTSLSKFAGFFEGRIFRLRSLSWRYYSTEKAVCTPFFLKISRKITFVPKMHREGVKGVFSPFFCIKRLMELHMSCKIENKMQDEREKRSWLSCVQNKKSDR
ncbi:MAG: hypothetical protein IIW08_05005, partial [Clostridia bacterium]|nr:hypothetical protein [Clostridia bacterium]